MAQGGIDGEGMVLLTGCLFMLQVAWKLVEARLLVDGLLDELADIDHSEVDETDALRGIELRGGLHEPHVALADQILHRQAASLILLGNGDHETEVGFYQLLEGFLVATEDFCREFALLGVCE